MATTGSVYGKIFVMKNNGTTISGLLTNDINFTRAFRNVTTKDSANWNRQRPTIKSVSLNCTFLFAFDATEGVEEIYDDWAEDTAVTWRVVALNDAGTAEVSGNTYWSGSGYIASISFSAPHDGNVEATATIEGDGSVTKLPTS